MPARSWLQGLLGPAGRWSAHSRACLPILRRLASSRPWLVSALLGRGVRRHPSAALPWLQGQPCAATGGCRRLPRSDAFGFGGGPQGRRRAFRCRPSCPPERPCRCATSPPLEARSSRKLRGVSVAGVATRGGGELVGAGPYPLGPSGRCVGATAPLAVVDVQLFLQRTDRSLPPRAASVAWPWPLYRRW